MGIHPQLANVDLAVYGDLAVGRVVILNNPPASSGRALGESVGGIFEMDSSDWSNGIRYHTFSTRPDTEFNLTVCSSVY